jgi:hypothetical protein
MGPELSLLGGSAEQAVSASHSRLVSFIGRGAFSSHWLGDNTTTVRK